ncbi:MAG TPA: SPFH domain-containing protein [Candidatus Saccharimonadales bacterium]|nr:SPFH domain-containing protein [Candidatus Saccharimonadales bacterium]
MSSSIVVLLVIVALIIIYAAASFFTIEQQTIGVVERFGKFLRLASPGLHMRIPLIDKVAARMSLQVLQVEQQIETKTKDNVFVSFETAIQYRVDAQRVKEAHYLLNDPQSQMEAFTSDVVRSKLPVLDLDSAYADVEGMALAIEKTLRERMEPYGYTIVKALVLNINPATEVKEAMNRINASRRNQEAAIAQGEADKILVVKRAEAEAESKKLQGEGVAAQRRAIIDGLRDSVAKFATETGVNPQEAMQLVTLTGYTDMLRDVAASSKTNTIMLPPTPSGVSDLLSALKANGSDSEGTHGK